MHVTFILRHLLSAVSPNILVCWMETIPPALLGFSILWESTDSCKSFFKTIKSSENKKVFFNIYNSVRLILGFPGDQVWWRIHLPSRRYGFDLWVEKYPGEGNGNPLQYSCLGNSMDRGAWQATAHGRNLSYVVGVGLVSTEELMLLNCGVGEDSWDSLGLQGEPTSPF